MSPRRRRFAIRASRGSHRGFTLVELLLVLTILSILASISAPRFRSLRDRWQFEEAARLLLTDLRRAQGEAVRHGGFVVLEFHGPGPDRYELSLVKPVEMRPIEDWFASAAEEDLPEVFLRRDLPEDTRCLPPEEEIRFAPDGTNSGGVIWMLSDESRLGFTLTLDAVVGGVAMEPMAVDPRAALLGRMES